MQGEPITFSEDLFVNHRSSSMKLFLHNAIQLQLFKQVHTHTHVRMCVCGGGLTDLCLQFIDGRLNLLNSGEGFSDAFEEEISMSEYAGQCCPSHPPS